MALRTVWVLVLGALAGCGGSGPETQPVAVPSRNATLSAEAAGSLLTTAARQLASGTGSFKQVITITDAGVTITETNDGVFDGARKLWQSDFEARQGDKPIGALQLIGSADALYLTSPSWPADMVGRWLRLTSADLGTAAGALAQGQRITDTPDAVFAVSTAMASGGHQLAAGTTIEAELPAAEALGLGGLRGGLTKLKVDLQSLAGVADVRVLLGKDGQVQQLTMARGALHAVASQLPASLRTTADQVAVSVQFSGLGAPVDIELPGPDDLLSSPGPTS